MIKQVARENGHPLPGMCLASEIWACDFLQTNQLGDLAHLATFLFRTIFVNVIDA